jgi:translation elongation factor EF-Tu-like GTPase
MTAAQNAAMNAPGGGGADGVRHPRSVARRDSRRQPVSAPPGAGDTHSMALSLSCEVRLLATAEGGRQTALASGWRGVVSFGELWTERDARLWPDVGEPLPVGEELVYGSELRLDPGSEILAPGDIGLAEITLPFHDEPRPAIRPGASFELREGSRKVGAGKVLEIATGRDPL